MTQSCAGETALANIIRTLNEDAADRWYHMCYHRLMALTRDFKETVRARVQRDPAFRRELLREGVESFLTGDVETGKTILRDYINATIGFHELAAITHHSPKSLMRMLGPSGNPYARHLFEIVSCLQKKTGVHFQLKASAATAGR